MIKGNIVIWVFKVEESGESFSFKELIEWKMLEGIFYLFFFWVLGG